MKLSVALLALGGTIANHGSSAFQTPTTVGRTSILKNNNRAVVGGSESSALMAATMDGTAVAVNGGQKRKKTKAVSSRKLNIVSM